jgi:hypothetical protein
MELNELNKICARMIEGRQGEFEERGMRIKIHTVNVHGIIQG